MPYLRSSLYRATVGPGPEFGLAPEVDGDLIVVPAQIDIGRDRIDIAFDGVPPGEFADTAFNGYILEFEADCVLFRSARLDAKATTLPLVTDAIRLSPQSLSLNVAGIAHDTDSTIGVLLDVADCPLS